MFVDKPVDK
jgi:hypothetical protein